MKLSAAISRTFLRLQWASVLWVTAAIMAGGLAALLPPEAALLLLSVMALALLMAMTPLAALTVMLILAPLRTLIATEAPFQLPLDIGQIMFLLFIFTWGLYRIARKQPLLHLPGSPVLLPVLLFVAATGLTVFSAASLNAWLTEWLKWLIIPVMIILVMHIGQRENWQWVIFALVMSGVANAVVGLYIFFGGSGADHLVIASRFFRAFGTFGQPNPFAGFLGLLTPVALTLVYGYVIRAWQRRRMRGVVHLADLIPVIFYLAAALVMSAAIFASWSRGAWLALVIALAAVAFALPRCTGQSILFVLAIGSLVAALWLSGVLPESVIHRITSSTQEFFNFADVRGVDITPANYAVVERLAHWQAALNMVRENPWFGVGFGNYEVVYDHYRLINWSFPLGHAHNYYLNILAETGMIGFLAYSGLWAGIIRFTWRIRRHPDPLVHAIAAGLLGTWVYLSVHSFLDNLYVNNVFLHLGTLSGILASLNYQTWSAQVWEQT